MTCNLCSYGMDRLCAATSSCCWYCFLLCSFYSFLFFSSCLFEVFRNDAEVDLSEIPALTDAWSVHLDDGKLLALCGARVRIEWFVCANLVAWAVLRDYCVVVVEQSCLSELVVFRLDSGAFIHRRPIMAVCQVGRLNRDNHCVLDLSQGLQIFDAEQMVLHDLVVVHWENPSTLGVESYLSQSYLTPPKSLQSSQQLQQLLSGMIVRVRSGLVSVAKDEQLDCWFHFYASDAHVQGSSVFRKIADGWLRFDLERVFANWQRLPVVVAALVFNFLAPDLRLRETCRRFRTLRCQRRNVTVLRRVKGVSHFINPIHVEDAWTTVQKLGAVCANFPRLHSLNVLYSTATQAEDDADEPLQVPCGLRHLVLQTARVPDKLLRCPTLEDLRLNFWGELGSFDGLLDCAAYWPNLVSLRLSSAVPIFEKKNTKRAEAFFAQLSCLKRLRVDCLGGDQDYSCLAAAPDLEEAQFVLTNLENCDRLLHTPFISTRMTLDLCDFSTGFGPSTLRQRASAWSAAKFVETLVLHCPYWKSLDFLTCFSNLALLRVRHCPRSGKLRELDCSFLVFHTLVVSTAVSLDTLLHGNLRNLDLDLTREVNSELRCLGNVSPSVRRTPDRRLAAHHLRLRSRARAHARIARPPNAR